jgi:hypothetical protein
MSVKRHRRAVHVSEVEAHDDRGPTPERLQRARKAFVVAGTVRRRIVQMCDTPLERLLLRDQLSLGQFNALRKLREHWFLGQLAGHPRAVNLDRILAPTWDGLALGERELEHRGQFRWAWLVLTALERQVVYSVALAEAELLAAGAAMGYRSPHRARQNALTVLRAAADRLVKLWRIV